MFLGKKRDGDDEKKRLEDQRQKAISFKRFFGTEEGREVMFDLMNKFYLINPLPDTNDPMDLALVQFHNPCYGFGTKACAKYFWDSTTGK